MNIDKTKLSFVLMSTGMILFFLPILGLTVSSPLGINIINSFQVLILQNNYIAIVQMLVGVIVVIIGVRVK